MNTRHWPDIVKDSCIRAMKLGREYFDRLKYEHKEIIKQGANQYWIELINGDTKYDHNKNGLVLPFLYGITDIDPIIGENKIFVNGDEKKISGIEIVLENGKIINTSNNTLVKTTRGIIKAEDLSVDDELC